VTDRLVLLGTGTCQLQPERRASSVLVEVGASRFVFDMGRGIAERLAALPLRQDDVEHIVVSHFHADHLSDLIPYLHAASWSQIDPRHRDLHIHGPAGLEHLLETLFGALGRDSLIAPAYTVHVHEIAAGAQEIADLECDWVSLPPAGNHGLRFRVGERTVALTGDSDFHPREIEFLSGVDLAVIDAGHPSDEEIVDLAVASGAARILCSHLYRPLDGVRLTEQAAVRGYEGVIEVAEDGLIVAL